MTDPLLRTWYIRSDGCIITGYDMSHESPVFQLMVDLHNALILGIGLADG